MDAVGDPIGAARPRRKSFDDYSFYARRRARRWCGDNEVAPSSSVNSAPQVYGSRGFLPVARVAGRQVPWVVMEWWGPTPASYGDLAIEVLLE